MKKITILRKKEVILGLLAIFFLVIGFLSYNPIFKKNIDQISVTNNSSEEIGDVKLVSSNVIEENYIQNDNNNEIIDNTIENEDYFIEAKMDRENTYSKSLEVYEIIIENSNITGDQKIIAQNEISRITNERTTISISENLIKLKGFDDVVIFKNDVGISVIVKSDVLQKEQVAQIQNIVEREFQVDGKNITITCK